MRKLNRELRGSVAAGIRAGGFGHVAAQAFQVSRKSFRRWQALGRSNESDEPFRSFARAVDEALGQARLRAEITVFNDEPRFWLQHGPGRETIDAPGWTSAVKPMTKRMAHENALLTPAATAMMRELMQVLAPHPELRAEAARVFEKRREV